MLRRVVYFQEINNKLNDLQTSTNLLQDQMNTKMFEWKEIKQSKEEEAANNEIGKPQVDTLSAVYLLEQKNRIICCFCLL